MLSIRVTGAFDRPSIDKAMQESFAIAEAVHNAMSQQSASSDLAHIKKLRPGETFQLHPNTHKVLTLALELAEESNGLFDPVRPSTHKFMRKSKHANWQDICLTKSGNVSVRRPLAISLDGIAKGYGADAVCRKMREVTDADICVDAGGDLSVSSQNPVIVGVRDAASPGNVSRTISLSSGGIATSSNYGCDTQLWSKGRALNWPGSVTAAAPTCAIADAFTKIAPQTPPKSLLNRYGVKVLGACA